MATASPHPEAIRMERDPAAAAPSAAGYSLRRRIVAASTIAACLVWCGLGLVMVESMRSASAREFDERLAIQAGVVLGFAEHEFAETGHAISIDAARNSMPETRPDVIHQVWTDDAQPVHLSMDAPPAPLAPLQSQGFTDRDRAGGAWRVYSARSTTLPLVVQVGEPLRHRAEIARRAVGAVLWPLALALPLFAVLVGWAVTRSFRPLDRLAAEIGGRTAFDLKPLDPGALPRETVALGQALNSLILRQAEEVAHQQRFASHAAHELRTPLAALRMQAQVALRARTRDESEIALKRLMDGVDRTSRLVGQLLSLARTDSELRTEELPIGTVVDVVLRDLHALAAERDVRVEVAWLPYEASDSRVPEEPLYLILRNLVENALRHAPSGSSVDVTTTVDDCGMTLTVADRGPGIPPELIEAAFEPFRRLDHGGDGIGLGLAIVRRVTESLGGSIELTPRDGGGLAARVTLNRQGKRSASGTG